MKKLQLLALAILFAFASSEFTEAKGICGKGKEWRKGRCRKSRKKSTPATSPIVAINPISQVKPMPIEDIQPADDLVKYWETTLNDLIFWQGVHKKDLAKNPSPNQIKNTNNFMKKFNETVNQDKFKKLNDLCQKIKIEQENRQELTQLLQRKPKLMKAKPALK